MNVSNDNTLRKIKLAQDNDSEVKVIKKLLEVSNYDSYWDRNGGVWKFLSGKFLPESM